MQLQLESVALKGRPIPRVASLVESMFMAEPTNLLLTAGHDLDAVEGPVTLDVSDGTQRYGLMSGSEQQTAEGCQGRRENVPAGRSKTVPLNATL